MINRTSLVIAIILFSFPMCGQNFATQNDNVGHRVFSVNQDTIGVLNSDKINFYALDRDSKWKLLNLDFQLPNQADELVYMGGMILGVRFDQTIKFYRKNTKEWQYLSGMDFHSLRSIRGIFYMGDMTIGIRELHAINIYEKKGTTGWKLLPNMVFKPLNKNTWQAFHIDTLTIGLWADTTVKFYVKREPEGWAYIPDMDFPLPITTDEIFFMDKFVIGVRNGTNVIFYRKTNTGKWSIEKGITKLNIEDISIDDYSPLQGYLKSAPEGINALYAWQFPGGTGANVKIILLDAPLDISHVDFKKPFGIWGSDVDSRGSFWGDHGTSALGEIIGQHNGFGISGICPSASFGVCGTNNSDEYADPFANSIDTAASRLERGDIIVIERFSTEAPVPRGDQGCAPSTYGSVPIEYEQKCFDAIRRASDKGIIVVEPAANGGVDLDDTIYHSIFDRNFRNSGAIMIAADEGGNNEPACFTNFGSRIDYFAWGANIVTTGGGNLPKLPYDMHRKYTKNFNGTSGATPIVAGAIACLQGIRKMHGEKPFTSEELLKVIKGTKQRGSLKKIGVMPDLKATIECLQK